VPLGIDVVLCAGGLGAGGLGAACVVVRPPTRWVAFSDEVPDGLPALLDVVSVTVAPVVLACLGW
jgi:hypothetical protein